MFASDLLSGLTAFRDHLLEAASPLVGLVEADLAKLAPVVMYDVRQAEAVAKEILHGLYSGKVITLDQPPAPVITGGYPAPVSVPSSVVQTPVSAPAMPAPTVEAAPAAPVATEPAAAPVAEEAAEPAHAPEDEPPTTATA